MEYSINSTGDTLITITVFDITGNTSSAVINLKDDIIAPNTSAIILPAVDGDTISANGPFVWSVSTDTKTTEIQSGFKHYLVEIDTGILFENSNLKYQRFVLTDTGLDSAEPGYDISKLTPDTYYLRVTVIDNVGNSDSSVRKFTTESAPPSIQQIYVTVNPADSGICLFHSNETGTIDTSLIVNEDTVYFNSNNSVSFNLRVIWDAVNGKDTFVFGNIFGAGIISDTDRNNSAEYNYTINGVEGKQILNGYDSTGLNCTSYINYVNDTVAPLVTRVYPEIAGFINDSTPQFIWSDTIDDKSGLKQYALEISDSSSFSNIIYTNITRDTNITLSTDSGLTNGTYYWRVLFVDNVNNNSDTFASGGDSFIIDLTLPVIQSIVFAATSDTAFYFTNRSVDTAILSGDTVWYNGVYANTITINVSVSEMYLAQIQANSLFGESVQSDTDSPASFIYSIETNSNDTVLYITAYDSALNYSTVPVNIIMDNGRPDTAIYSTPLQGETNVSSAPSFTWIAAIDSPYGKACGIAYYIIEICTETFSSANILLSDTSSSVNYNVPSAYRLLPDTDYYWRVLAVDRVGNISDSSISDTRLFRTGLIPLPGEVIISEIMYKPLGSESSSNSYEWFEIYNNSNKTFNMNGWWFKDNASNTVTIGDSVLVPNDYFVIGASGNSWIDFQYKISTGINLSASGDTILLYAADNTLIDSVDYSLSSFNPTAAVSQSIYLTNLNADNNEGSNWQKSESNKFYSEFGIYGTPGYPNAWTRSEAQFVNVQLGNMTSYRFGDTIYVLLNDPDQNTDTSSIETIAVSLFTGTETETIILSESGISADTFFGQIKCDSGNAAADGILKGDSSGFTIRLTYIDPNDTIAFERDTALAYANVSSLMILSITDVPWEIIDRGASNVEIQRFYIAGNTAGDTIINFSIKISGKTNIGDSINLAVWYDNNPVGLDAGDVKIGYLNTTDSITFDTTAANWQISGAGNNFILTADVKTDAPMQGWFKIGFDTLCAVSSSGDSAPAAQQLSNSMHYIRAPLWWVRQDVNLDYSADNAYLIDSNNTVAVKIVTLHNPGVFDSSGKDMYAVDGQNDSGIRIRSDVNLNGVAGLGEYDTIYALATSVDSYNGIFRLNVSNITENIRLIGQADTILPLGLDFYEIKSNASELIENRLIKDTGVVSYKSGNNIFITDSFGTSYVYITSAAGITTTAFGVGDTLVVTGIAGQYDNSSTNDSHEILPRYQSDIVYTVRTPQIIAVSVDSVEDTYTYRDIIDSAVLGVSNKIADTVYFNNKYYNIIGINVTVSDANDSYAVGSGAFLEQAGTADYNNSDSVYTLNYQIDSTILTNTYAVVTAYDATGYNDSVTLYFQLDITNPTIAVLDTPVAGLEVQGYAELKWSGASDTESGIKNYKVDIANDSLFNTIVSTTFTSDTYLLMPGGIGNDTKWWRVTVFDNVYNYDTNTNIDSFILLNQLPVITNVSVFDTPSYNVSFASDVHNSDTLNTVIDTIYFNNSNTAITLNFYAYWN
ncbi:MAG TPA: lamin tail domain-containing protein, partial [bacterium]|nr:lamin tail domain-containing protein [bacterium]